MAIPNWLTLSQESGNTGQTVVVLTADSNTTYNERNYVFTVSTDNTGKQKQVQIIQNASGADDYSLDYLTFEIVSGGTIKFNGMYGVIQYSKNGGDWVTANTGTTLTVQEGDEIEWKGGVTNPLSPRFSSASTATYNVYGNVMSLLYEDDFVGKTDLSEKGVSLKLLFYNNKLIDAGGLVLPATTLINNCYESMFNGCTGLTAAPATLPATELTKECYLYMFGDCTSLTKSPQFTPTTVGYSSCSLMFNNCSSLTTTTSVLPATTLAERCYSQMFRNCTSLSVAPQLPATTLAELCYNDMFGGCSSLTTAPALPATTLANNCYEAMFMLCTSLSVAPQLPATTLAEGCYTSMFAGCTSLTGVPTNYLPATTMAASAYSFMFEGCTGITTAPELPATTLADVCYQAMFRSCRSLTAAPELPATNLAPYCYDNMFDRCTGITTAPELPATILPTMCYQGMFAQCYSLTTAPSEIPATSMGEDCCGAMFWYCSGLTAAPSTIGTSATTMGASACTSMFQGCTSLIVAPALLSPTLAPYSYYEMFEGCSNLHYILCFATDISANNCTSYWVKNVPNTGVFIKYTGMSGWSLYNVNGIPDHWGVFESTEIINLMVSTSALTSTGAENRFDFVDVVSTSNWTASTNVDWITLSITSGVVGEYRLGNIDVSENTTGNQRVGTITITNDEGYTVTITVTQQVADYSNEWLTFSVLSGGSFMIQSRNLPVTYSLNNRVPETLTTAKTLTLNDGDKLRLMRESANTQSGEFYSFIHFDLWGNILSLNNSNSFKQWFAAMNVHSANKLIMPSTTVDCRWMFSGCTNLIAAPELPATALTDYSYMGMFQHCTSLTTAPELPILSISGVNACYGMFSGCTSLTQAPSSIGTSATTVFPVVPTATQQGAFQNMFYGCTSLETAPELPITGLTDYCYKAMFRGCTSLTTAPVLPATTLGYHSYQDMFNGCTALTRAPELPATTLTNGCYQAMFNYCTNLTTAPDLPATELAPHCYDSMFADCTSLTTAPKISATTLASGCCTWMFAYCTSLTTGPDLLAPTLVSECYRYMFYSATSLNYIKCLATNPTASNPSYNPTEYWVSYVPSTGGTFVKNASTPASKTITTGIGWKIGANNGIPTNWRVING